VVAAVGGGGRVWKTHGGAVSREGGDCRRMSDDSKVCLLFKNKNDF